jgi:hypothetical protein
MVVFVSAFMLGVMHEAETDASFSILLVIGLTMSTISIVLKYLVFLTLQYSRN